ncbi:MAG: UvrD-helicase domain-containing protein [Gemmatimonadetes bacterium]|nr:UvrD-helicase domain-containing protein [Gemmatimonadota bacterium]
MTTSDLTLALNPEQREAALHVEGPMLVLAGAGSGKTRVLTTRIAMLIERHGVRADRIFAVTFTNRAAGEMRERIGAMLDRPATGLWIGTFHSLSARLLRREAEHLGFSREFTIYDEDDRLALIKRILEQRNHSPKLFPPKLVQNIISGAKNRMQSADQLAASGTEPLIEVAADVYRGLTTALKQQNAMDFDDLMLHPLTLFREHPERLAWYQRRFDFVLVDEFQDTNKAQYQLVRLLGQHGNVFVVGDDDQSIYAWRGAEVRNMREFQSDFAGCRLVRLEENYRSTQVVLDAANAAIAPNAGRIGKTLRTRRSGGEPVTLLGAADERDEAEWVARELGARRSAGDYTAGQMAVLYRTNAQSRAMEEAFRRAGIPYRIVGSVSFYDRREVKDLLAYLRLIVNPADDEAFLRAIGVPKRGIGDTSVALLREAAIAWQKPLLETAAVGDRISGLRPNVREAFRRFGDLIAGLRDRVGARPPAEVLEAVIEALGYERVLHDEGPEGKDRWDNVRELVAAAAGWSEVVTDDEEPATPLQRFLAEAALLSNHDTQEGDEAGVTLMTMHTAKGLEWPVVVVAGLEDGLFPLSRATESVEGLEEERRLFYVALTRAKDKLYLTHARSRRRGGEILPSMPSRFLESLPPGILDEKTTSSLFAPSWGGGGAGGGRYGRSGGGWRSTGSWQADRGPARPAAGRVERPAALPPEEVSQDAPRYVKGERVRHRRFGSGTIQGLSGAGKDLKVTVAFDGDVGIKQLLVAYAGLERDWEGA